MTHLMTATHFRDTIVVVHPDSPPLQVYYDESARGLMSRWLNPATMPVELKQETALFEGFKITETEPVPVPAEFDLQSLEQASLRERIVAALVAIATMSPPDEAIDMLADTVARAFSFPMSRDEKAKMRGWIHDAAQLGFGACAMLFQKHLTDALDETKPLTQDLIAILRNCTVVTTGHHGARTTSINIVGETDTVISLREIVTALSGGIEAPMGCWRGERIVDLLNANTAEVKWRRALQRSLSTVLTVCDATIPERLKTEADAVLSGSIRTENADDDQETGCYPE